MNAGTPPTSRVETRLLDADDQLSTRSSWKNPTLIAIVAASVISSAILVFSDGNVALALALYAGVIGISLTVYRVEWGFYMFIGCVLLFDQYTIPEFDPITYKVGYFANLNQSYLLNVPGVVVNPLELHLLFLGLVWVTKIALRKDVQLQRIPVWPAAVVFFVALTLSLIGGLGRGGLLLPALWEVRALFYLGIVYVLVPQIIQTRRQVINVLWICIIAITVKALQGIMRFVELGFSFGSGGALTGHEDAAFIVTLIVFLIALTLFRVRSPQRRVLFWVLPVLVAGFITAQRRAAFGSLGASILVLFILVPRRQRWSMVKFLAPALVIFGAYLTVFWNSGSQLGKTAQMIKSSFSNDRETAGEKYFSNLYRVYERYNLAVTIRRSPITGVGFGNKYDMPIRLPGEDFTMRVYIAHNEILWLFAKMGAAGFFTFWFFFNSFMYRGASAFTRLQDPMLKAICAMLIAAVINQIFVSYFDLQLTFYRNMAYLGTLMGLLPTLGYIQDQEKKLTATNA